MTSSKPTPADIMTAIAKAESGDWIDPLYQPIFWYAELGDPDGTWFWNGCGHTPAMAMAWLHYWAPDALISAYIEVGSVPFEIPDGPLARLVAAPSAQADVALKLRRIPKFPLRLLDGAMHGPWPDHVAATQQGGHLF
jgi:hypothetical protein